nr:thymidine phosphorylase family protein [Marinicella rhabdoformis]
MVGIHSHQPIVYMREDCHICQSEGYRSLVRLKLTHLSHQVIAELHVVNNDFLEEGLIGLNKRASDLLHAKDSSEITISQAPPVLSMSEVRGKIYNQPFTFDGLKALISDIKHGFLTDIDIASFISICAGGRLNDEEIIWLTKAMVESGHQMTWPMDVVVDKHCIGGIPGNRTTPIVVSIVASCGLFMPKTSSRAITSPAGTADAMESITEVNISINRMRTVLLEAKACLAWGGSVNLSPADDILIRVEKALNIDSDGQLIASVLSKKIAAGSTHVLIDIPVGDTAKVRNKEDAQRLSELMINTGKALGLKVETVITDGTAPIGNGIGPTLEMKDVLMVLENSFDAPEDLKIKSLNLSAKIIEMSGITEKGLGLKMAVQALVSGNALKKFRQICMLQGGIKELGHASYTQNILSDESGVITHIDNRLIARLAKLAGAPDAKTAGLFMQQRPGRKIMKGEVLMTIHTESNGQLKYAMNFYNQNKQMIRVGDKL